MRFRGRDELLNGKRFGSEWSGNSGTKIRRKVCEMLLDRVAKNRKALYKYFLNLIVLRERAQNPLRMKRDMEIRGNSREIGESLNP
jgi:hypothetical protein